MVQTMTEAVKSSHVADDVLFEEVKSHAVFCLEKSEQVFGKDEILEKVLMSYTKETVEVYVKC